jgi:hypothetical protein
MSTPEGQGPPPGAQGPEGEPTEEELRAAYEAELSRVTVTDMIAQALVSLLNIGAYRLAPSAPGETPASAPAQRDLGQARDAIDAAMGLLVVLERSLPQDVAPLRDALSQLQMAYAREAQVTPPPAAGAPAPAAGGPAEQAAPGAVQDDGEEGPGPAESSGRLWVPGR